MKVGSFIEGFCGGAFGRDFWGPAIVEAVGDDWLVARDDKGQAWFTDKPELVAEENR